MFKYRIVQKDGREYNVSSDLAARQMIDQEKRQGLLKEMFLYKGQKDSADQWEKVYPEAPLWSY